jgi:hypothetical protein
VAVTVNENEALNAALDRAVPDQNQRLEPQRGIDGAPRASVPAASFDMQQWSVGPNGMYRPCGLTERTVQPGVYRFAMDNVGIYLQQAKVVTDDLIVLPDTANERVLSGMQKFWASRERYEKYGLIYKRGVLLWGPPGSGKTATLQLMMQQLVKLGGIVVLSDDPEGTVALLHMIRKIEPSRNIIVVLEDVDETVKRYGEHTLLALLDGEFQIDNCVMVATTNYPELLGARIVNRPSRFDERILVDMPSAAARRIYLCNVAPELSPERLEQWVQDTDKMSVAHLRELAAAVLCLDQEYDEVLERLRAMRTRPRETSDGFNKEAVGFGGKQTKGYGTSSAPLPS